MRTWTARHRLWAALAALLLACLTASVPARAELADIADVPLANSPSDAVLPNLTYILDDSGSMSWDYMPDNVYDLADGTSIRNGKTCGSSSCTTAGNQLQRGEPPYYATQFNQIYYNPDITYAPGVDYLGASLGNQVSPWTAVKNDAYNAGLGTTNLVANFREIVYCNKTSPSAADLVNSNGSNDCKRNGIDNGAFLYWGTSGANVGYPVATGNSSSTYRYAHVLNTSPYYFTITAIEYCSDQNLTVCTAATAPTGAFTIPAPIRYCRTTANAAAAAPVSGITSGTPKCQKKFDESNYPYPRYGRFTRTNIVSGTATYPKSATARRADCANAAYCTYAEEMTNFANWWAYYRTRMQMMKTATGRAFVPIDDRHLSQERDRATRRLR